jgi:hypothetical protein
MDERNGYYVCAATEVGTKATIEAQLAIPDSTVEGGYRRERTKVEAMIISYRTSHADPTVLLPVLAYVSPASGTMHVLEPYEGKSAMGPAIHVNRVTLSINALKKLAKFAGITQ